MAQGVNCALCTLWFKNVTICISLPEEFSHVNQIKYCSITISFMCKLNCVMINYYKSIALWIEYIHIWSYLFYCSLTLLFCNFGQNEVGVTGNILKGKQYLIWYSRSWCTRNCCIRCRFGSCIQCCIRSCTQSCSHIFDIRQFTPLLVLPFSYSKETEQHNGQEWKRRIEENESY